MLCPVKTIKVQKILRWEKLQTARQWIVLNQQTRKKGNDKKVLQSYRLSLKSWKNCSKTYGKSDGCFKTKRFQSQDHLDYKIISHTVDDLMMGNVLF